MLAQIIGSGHANDLALELRWHVSANNLNPNVKLLEELIATSVGLSKNKNVQRALISTYVPQWLFIIKRFQSR